MCTPTPLSLLQVDFPWWARRGKSKPHVPPHSRCPARSPGPPLFPWLQMPPPHYLHPLTQCGALKGVCLLRFLAAGACWKRQFNFLGGGGVWLRKVRTETCFVWGPETIQLLLHPLQSQLRLNEHPGGKKPGFPRSRGGRSFPLSPTPPLGPRASGIPRPRALRSWPCLQLVKCLVIKHGTHREHTGPRPTALHSPSSGPGTILPSSSTPRPPKQGGSSRSPFKQLPKVLQIIKKKTHKSSRGRPSAPRKDELHSLPAATALPLAVSLRPAPESIFLLACEAE